MFIFVQQFIKEMIISMTGEQQKNVFRMAAIILYMVGQVRGFL